MLNWLRREWLFVTALAVAISFWVLALSGTLAFLVPQIESGTQNAAAEGNQNHPLADGWNWLTKDSISFFTAVLAFFTGALVWVALLEIGYLKRADKTSRKLIKITKRQLAIQAAQTDLMEMQKEIARQQFLADNRPHLIVRNVHAIGAEPGENIAIKFEVINDGAANAYIVGSAFEIHFVPETETFHDLHFPAVGEPPTNMIGRGPIIPSAVYRGEFKSEQRWTGDHFDDPETPDAGFFWGGKILYQDATGKQRRLGVYRRLALPSRRFRPVNDPEFEYDD